MQKRKNGFVYIWFDRKHKRYYIGSHWGSEDDGYICSSTHMKRAYKRRPSDFKRRILQRLENCIYSALLEQEENWLSLIKNEELGKRYYNQHNKARHWASLDTSKSVGQKISESHKANPNWGSWVKGKKLSDETKQKLREANKKQFNDENRKKHSEITKTLWENPEYRENQIAKKSGIKRNPISEETKKKISLANQGKRRSNSVKQQKSELMLKKWQDPKYKLLMANARN